jgi:uroporphyrinogen decarboxylase
MEPMELRRRFPELALFGGIDKRALFGGKAAIRAELERKVPALLDGGGYFPCLDHHVPADISFEAFCQYLEMLRAIEGQG